MPHQVQIASGKVNVLLPNGGTYKAGDIVSLKDDEFNKIDGSLIPSYVIDNGIVDDVAGVKVQVHTGKKSVVLPNGAKGDAGKIFNLTPTQFAQIPQSVFTNNWLDNIDEKLVVIEIGPVSLSTITAAAFASYKPGFAGTVVGLDFVTTTAVTTASKAATVTPAVAATPTTGGAVALTSAAATPAGKTINGSAVTSGGAFTNSQTITLVGSSVTAFVEGAGVFMLRLLKS